MRIRTRGMFLVDGKEKFFARGVSYGPFRPNDLGHFLPEKETVERDFRLIRELGANTIRLYHVPPASVRELAAAFDLRLLVGIPWAQHVRFLDTRADRQEVRRRVREAAVSMRGSSHLLALLIGNEISPQVVRWYGPSRVEKFLKELMAEVKDVDPEALVSYANFPMTEYLELGFLDFLSFNVYLHRERDFRRYVARLQNLSGFKPLLLTEFGVDSWREGEPEQARVIGTSAAAAAEMGCAGTVVFSYTDEWFTGGHEIEDWAFGVVTPQARAEAGFRRALRCLREASAGAAGPCAEGFGGDLRLRCRAYHGGVSRVAHATPLSELRGGHRRRRLDGSYAGDCRALPAVPPHLPREPRALGGAKRGHPCGHR